jgi:hypothetical protein
LTSRIRAGVEDKKRFKDRPAQDRIPEKPPEACSGQELCIASKFFEGNAFVSPEVLGQLLLA